MDCRVCLVLTTTLKCDHCFSCKLVEESWPFIISMESPISIHEKIVEKTFQFERDQKLSVSIEIFFDKFPAVNSMNKDRNYYKEWVYFEASIVFSQIRTQIFSRIYNTRSFRFQHPRQLVDNTTIPLWLAPDVEGRCLYSSEERCRVVAEYCRSPGGAGIADTRSAHQCHGHKYLLERRASAKPEIWALQHLFGPSGLELASRDR